MSDPQVVSPTRHDNAARPVRAVPHNFPPLLTLAQVHRLGLMSKTAWAGRGRRLQDGAVPVGIVSQVEVKVRGIGAQPVVKDLGGDFYLVSARYYEVYSESQTTTKQSRSKKQGCKNSDRIISSPLSRLSSLVSPEVTETATIARDFKAKHAISKSRTSPLAPRAVNKDAWAYVPISLTEEDKSKLGPDLEVAYCVMHLLHYFRVRQQMGRHDWIALSRDYCVDRFGGRSGTNWYQVRDKMLAHKILFKTEETVRQDEYGLGIEQYAPRGFEGHLPYGYRLREDLRAAKTRKTPLTDPRAVKISLGKQVSGYTLRWLEKNLHRVSIEPVPHEKLVEIATHDDDPTATAEDKSDAYAEAVRWITEGSYYFTIDDFSGRVHTNLTGLKRELRPYLRVDGRPLTQIDIPCSQLAFIGLCARAAEGQYRKKFVDGHFFEVWGRDLYTHLGDQLGLSRKEVKLHLTQRALFSSNRSDHQRHPVKKAFDAEFPLLASFIKMVKDLKPKATADEDTKRKPYRVLAQKAQKAEREFVIDGVCRRLRSERPDMWASTIHDSVIVTCDDAEYARAVMLNEFAKQGLHPTLKFENYAN